MLQHLHEHQRGIAGGPLLDILQLRGPRPERVSDEHHILVSAGHHHFSNCHQHCCALDTQDYWLEKANQELDQNMEGKEGKYQ